MNNPPAFPRIGFGNPNYDTPGMTLRDYFAAKALQALIASKNPQTEADYAAIARWSFKFADAMLKERENP